MKLFQIVISLVLVATTLADPDHPNLAEPGPIGRTIAKGIHWPEGQALPTFATPAAAFDAISVRDLSADERITFSALQGQVNRTQPRIFLVDPRSEEGPDTWPDTLSLGSRHVVSREERDSLIVKYAGELKGVVLYDASRNDHLRNLAGTVAGIFRGIPMTAPHHERLEKMGVHLEVLEDLSGLPLNTALETYSYLHQQYWKDCERRLILSARPSTRGGDLHHTRDIAAAVGAAVVWLDCRIPEEREMLRRFFGDMKAGEAVVLGWYTTERSGITTASEFGIGTLPADFFMNGSVYAGVGQPVRIPAVPKCPPLANKTYVALYISDGDNIQYTQHALRRIWDQQRQSRGKVALNWTIAPGLVDIAPGILNYYYSTATDLDCFAAGPSGMGYLIPFNTLREPGAPLGTDLGDPARFLGYTSLTETYLQRSGLRIVTIWDDATSAQRAAYARNCRHLRGATVHNFRDVPSVAGSNEENRIRFEKLVIPYATTSDHLSSSLESRIGRHDGRAPQFLSYQINVWKELKPNRLVELTEKIKRRHPGKVEFVRADHYFQLFNQANGIPSDLTMSFSTTISPVEASILVDGTPSSDWKNPEGSQPSVTLDFGGLKRISRYRLYPAFFESKHPQIAIQVSAEGQSWETIDRKSPVAREIIDVEFPPVAARFFRVRSRGESLQLSEMEVFGTPSTNSEQQPK